ncbi:Protein of unknown function (DUF1800) [Seminavis robusta]|uniref:Uncharacterized protein n=1 Tax=Seminavis robusta TaxID=568900 RepID=A0A9N8E3I6_9STRA|nr:Protein of unknown function (DUF1800) [Seminavis robusta]|eukprot:Sro612_g175480.1 Protein of unknown function (DUF1800) (1005) ;mRNA; r:34930-38029
MAEEPHIAQPINQGRRILPLVVLLIITTAVNLALIGAPLLRHQDHHQDPSASPTNKDLSSYPAHRDNYENEEERRDLSAIPTNNGTDEQDIILRLSCPTELESSLEFSFPSPSIDHPTHNTSAAVSKRSTPSSYWIELTKSSNDTLCTLVQVHVNSVGETYLQPIARSYDNFNWEVTAGPYVNHLQPFRCFSNNNRCQINLDVAVPNNNPNQAIFQLTTFGRPSYYSRRTEIARFLEQATFGATRAEIGRIDNNHSSTTTPNNNGNATLMQQFADWVQDQMDPDKHPIMSHRAIFRRHLNARFESASSLGAVTAPCQSGTRYRRMAFSEKDINKRLTVSYFLGPHTNTSSSITSQQQPPSFVMLRVDGQFRTVVRAPIYRWNDEADSNNNDGAQPQDWPDGSYRICSIQYNGKRVGMTVEHPTEGCIAMVFGDPQSSIQKWTNPPVYGANNTTNSTNNVSLTVLEIPLESASVIDERYFPEEGTMPSNNEIILQTNLTHTECASLRESRNGERQEAVFALWNGSYYIHDPRFQLLSNTLDNPLPDGGGTVAQDNQNTLLYDAFSARCANTPRTFLNEHECVLSNHSNACPYDVSSNDDRVARYFQVTPRALRAIYQVTRDDPRAETAFLYAMEGLDIQRDPQVTAPCVPGSRSRWLSVPCSNNARFTDVNETTATVLARQLSRNVWREMSDRQAAGAAQDMSPPILLDVWRARTNLPDETCHAADLDTKGFEVPDIRRPRRCWKNVHPDHWNVYDFTYWVRNHPGNSDTHNPIREPAEAGNTTLRFPDWHEMTRWHSVKNRLSGPARLGSFFDFFELPLELRTQQIAQALGIDLASIATEEESRGPSGSRTLVCGSPFEVANEPSLGGSAINKGAFDASTVYLRSTTSADLELQRRAVWIKAVLEDPGQLRQRVAWALSQLLVISPATPRSTESYLAFYDIMVRNAFGNYRDVLKETSYSAMMAHMLTYEGGRSTAAVWSREGTLAFADENYAREVMQPSTRFL